MQITKFAEIIEVELSEDTGRVFNRILLDSAEQVLDKSCINGVLFKK